MDKEELKLRIAAIENDITCWKECIADFYEQRFQLDCEIREAFLKIDSANDKIHVLNNMIRVY